MESGDSKIDIRKWIHGRDIGGFIRSSIFFILFYLYLWLVVDLRLIYHGAGEIINFPSFFTGWAFFKEFVSRPGGPVEYISSFLSQLFYIGWAGALVATLQAWSICACIGYFLKTVEYRRLCWIRFIPSLLLLVIYTQYTYHFITVMAILVALVFVCLYLYMISKGPQLGWLHLIIFLILSVTLYYIAAGAYLLFAVICAMYELLFRGRWYLVTLYLLSAFTIPYVIGVLIFNESIVNAFSDLLPFSWKVLDFKRSRKLIKVVYLLYLVLPLAVLAAGFWRQFTKRSSLFKKTGKSKHGKNLKRKSRGKSSKSVAGIFSGYAGKMGFRWFIESMVLFVITAITIIISWDNNRKTLFMVDFYACHKMWPRVLESAKRHPNDYFVIHEVNRALYHIDRLNYDMFSYPQYPDALLLTGKRFITAYLKKSETYIELGHINLSENGLNESLEEFGERPLILKQLALINMVKGKNGAAKIYLRALGKTLFDADWANKYLTLLQTDPNLATDKEIQRLRSCMVEKDHIASIAREDILLDLLEKNPQNRMAFEYLMALYILTCQLERFANNFRRFDDFSYSEIPRIYEEALLLHVARTQKPFNLQGRQISMESHRRFKDFNKVFNRYKRNKEAAFNELASNYGNSYFLYYLYMIQAGEI